MTTIAEIIHQKKFPLRILDNRGIQIYWENELESWEKHVYQPNGDLIYYENSYGWIEDNRK